MELVGKAATAVVFGLIWLGIVAYVRLKKKTSVLYLMLFTIFYIYMFKVLDYTLFEFQSLLLLKYFVPNLMLKGQTAGHSINLVPLITLTAQDLKTSLLNILLFVPFGFGLPFITKFRAAKVILVGALVSISIELLQLITGFLAGITFRIADINDVIFNTTGAAIGYALFVGFVRLSRKSLANSIARYITKLTEIDR